MDDPVREQPKSTRALEQEADARRERQERRNPSGHGMQVTPGQQEEIANASDHTGDDEGPVAAIDERELKDLKE
jgi:hypothetical protein